MREAQHLAKVCQSVTIVHRRGELRAQAALKNLLESKDNVKFIFNAEVTEVLGDTKITGVKLKNTQTQETTDMPIDGLFVAIGHKPNTEFLKGQIELDSHGYIVFKDVTKTSVEGVFVAGDVSDQRYRQGVTAAGVGCAAALDAEWYLESNHA